jgi:hypothetical protein
MASPALALFAVRGSLSEGEIIGPDTRVEELDHDRAVADGLRLRAAWRPNKARASTAIGWLDSFRERYRFPAGGEARPVIASGE